MCEHYSLTCQPVVVWRNLSPSANCFHKLSAEALHKDEENVWRKVSLLTFLTFLSLLTFLTSLTSHLGYYLLPLLLAKIVELVGIVLCLVERVDEAEGGIYGRVVEEGVVREIYLAYVGC